MLRSLRIFLELLAFFMLLVSFGLFAVLTVGHLKMPIVLPFESLLHQMAKPFLAYSYPDIAYQAINSTKDLPVGWQQDYITASLIYTCIFFSGLLGSIFIRSIDSKLTIFSSLFGQWVKQSIFDVEKPSLFGPSVGHFNEFAGLLFFHVESNNPNAPLRDVVMNSLSQKPEAKLLSQQEEAFCIQTPNTLYTVKVIQQLIEGIREHNAGLKHTVDAIRFMGVVHSVESLKQLFEEDAYMKAVLDCAGKNQVLVSPEAKQMFISQAQHASPNGWSDLDMIYHGFYLEMGPSRKKTELYRLIKHL